MADLSLTRSGRLATIELCRPAVLNALSPTLLDELIDACGTLATDGGVSVVLLRGAGTSFSAGADLPAFHRRLETDPERTADLGRRAAEQLAGLPQITVAAIRGHCVGGGVVLAGACDLRVAASDARFAIPEVDAGIPLAWGGLRRLVELVGESRAMDLVLTCRPLDSTGALQAGLVGRVLDAAGFDSAIEEYAERLAARPAKVLALTKRQLAAIRGNRFDARTDARALLDAMADPEARACGARYLERTLRRR